MIRQEINNITVRMFDNIEDAQRIAELFDSDLTRVKFFQYNEHSGVVFSLDDETYDSEGRFGKYIKDSEIFFSHFKEVSHESR